MPSTREIRRRIRSTKNVGQITRAMEMVAASRMRRAQRNVESARPYSERMMRICQQLLRRVVDKTTNPNLFRVEEDIHSVGLIFITPDRGLCGSMVANILRQTAVFVREQKQQGHEVAVYAIGKKGRDFARRTRLNLIAEKTQISDPPKLTDILGVAINAIEDFVDGKHQEIYISYTDFVNTLVQRPTIRRILPVEIEDIDDHDQGLATLDYTYEPSQKEVLDELLPRIVESIVYQAVLESIASEHSARMVAMRNATNNSKELVRDLTLTYNKLRQSNITQEITEIATSAVAMEKDRPWHR
ncbi:MAG: ATP synthase F1 subunit gamma [Chloroflexaceae bacterium]|nr:ATP synthase F1 subunit gamma [Chloroflexaceae bacterium]